MDNKHNLLTIIGFGMSGSWFLLLEQHLNIIIGILTIIVLISALIANIAKTRRENSSRRIDELHELERQIGKNEQK